MNPMYRFARRMQSLGLMLPRHWQLPIRYRIQSLVGGLEPEFRILPQLVPAGRAAIDVGANMGVYTYALARLASRVLAVEPQASCCETIAAWGKSKDNVEVLNAGAGATPGQLTLHIPIVDGRPVGTRASFIPIHGEHRELHVPVHPLDDLGIRNVGFIKIDAEGFERDVLRGAIELLKCDKPNLLIEIDPKQLTAQEFAATFDLLADIGYRAHYYDGARLQPCSAEIQQRDPERYNFIFTMGETPA
jgi:FkbM family methyltransferase